MIKVNDSYMDYITFGKGSKLLILIPGLSLRGVKGSSIMLAYMYRIFAKDFKVYCFDRKNNIPASYNIENMALDIAFAIKKLKLESASVFGVSQGGMIAQYLAVNHPELVSKLVLGVTLSHTNETVTKVIADWVDMAENQQFRDIAKDMFKNMYSEKYVKKYKWLFSILSVFVKPKDTKRFITLAKACLTCNIYDRLNKIKCPVFVLGGSMDNIVSGYASEEIADKLKCNIYMYKNLGHSAYEEAKDFNKRVYDFIA